MVIPAPTPCAKSKEKIFSGSDWRQERTKPQSVLTILSCFLGKQRALWQDVLSLHTSSVLTNMLGSFSKLLKPNRNPRKGEKFPWYHNERKTTFLHNCWDLTRRRLLTVFINYMTLQTMRALHAHHFCAHHFWVCLVEFLKVKAGIPLPRLNCASVL